MMSFLSYLPFILQLSIVWLLHYFLNCTEMALFNKFSGYYSILIEPVPSAAFRTANYSFFLSLPSVAAFLFKIFFLTFP